MVAVPDPDLRASCRILDPPQARQVLGTLVLPEKDSDVPLVPLSLLGPEEGDDSLEPSPPYRTVCPEILRQLIPRGVDRQTQFLCKIPQPTLFLEVPGLCPRIHGSVLNRPTRIGNDQVLVVFQGRSETGALRAGSEWIVEGKELGGGLGKFLQGVADSGNAP